MKKWILLFVVILVFGFGFTFFATNLSASTPQEEKFLSPLAQSLEPSRVVEKPKQPVSILLLGFDGRKGDKNPRCDAIHMFSFDPTVPKIRMINVPRGTTVNLSKTESNYLSNLCHLKGVDFAVKEIAKITGVKPDYTVKVGFSQTIGVLRFLGLPANDMLRFLRNRRYGIGDNQRSYNQALFLKDLLVQLEKVTSLPKSFRFLVFSMVETDMDFEKADQLLSEVIQSGVLKNDKSIEMTTKPTPVYRRREIHFSDNSNNLNDVEFTDYQNNMISYLENVVSRTQKIIEAKNMTGAYQYLLTPFSQKLWEQIEDEEKRNQLHLALLKLFLSVSPKLEEKEEALDEFVVEMEIIGNETLATQVKELLGN